MEVYARHEFYPEANGIVLCYDCSSKESFGHLQQWVDEGSKYNATSVVPKEAATQFAKNLNTVAFQVSAELKPIFLLHLTGG
jgi:GTPase SAR1 family protein